VERKVFATKRVCFFLALLNASSAVIARNAIASQGADRWFAPLFNGKNLDGSVNVNCAPETFYGRPLDTGQVARNSS